MKHCEDFLELISAYVDGELSAAETAELEAHLEVCEDCRRTLEFYRTLHSLEQENLVEPPAGLHDSIMTAVKREKRKPFLRAIPALAGSLAACLVIAVGVGYFGGMGGGEETASADVMMYSRTMDTTAESANEAAPASVSGMTVTTTGAAENRTATFDEGPTYTGLITESASGDSTSYDGASTAAYDPTEAVESPYSDNSVERAGDSSDPNATEELITNFTSASDELPAVNAIGAEAVTEPVTDVQTIMAMAKYSVANAIVDNRIVIDADAVTDFSYDNRMYELSEASDLADMREKLDWFASLELTPLDEAPDVGDSAFAGVTVWLDDGSLLVFVCYPDDGYVVEGDNWYAFE